MKISLIMATLGRYEEIIGFLNSLQNQSYKNFELIIVDQNNNDKITNLCRLYSMNIRVVKSNVKGLSVNRNIGLQYISGNIIAFPDDDCEYTQTALADVAYFFEENPTYGFYTCNTKEKNHDSSVMSGAKRNQDVSIYNVMRTGISFTIFIRISSFSTFKFDEQLGVGAEFGSGEESDLLFFLLRNNNKGYYQSDNYIYHPARILPLEKSLAYGEGFGAVFKKSIIQYKFFTLAILFSLYLLKGILNIVLHNDKRNRLATLRGRISGFIRYKSKP